jgi:two-component system chemotaxis response regulator CheY
MENQKKRILAADDNDIMTDFYAMILKDNFPQFEIETFADGASLESKLKGGRNGIRVVITDNEMPGISGSSIIEKYAKSQEYHGIKFILCYGAGSDEIGKMAVNNGAFAYIIKPFKPDAIIKIVKNALDSTELSQ